MSRILSRGSFLFSLAVIAALSPKLFAQETPAAAPPKPPGKLYELRIYTAAEGKLDALNARFRDHTLRLFEKHGIENLYYWTVTQGANTDGDDAKNLLVYIIAHKDQAAAEASWAAFLADPDWKAAAAKSEENGKLLAKPPVSIFMTATEYSPPEAAPNKGTDAAPRLFELRKYNDGTARLNGTVDRFAAGEAKVFSDSGAQTLGFWTANDRSAFIYLLAYKDLAEREVVWGKFGAAFRPFMAEYNTQVAEGKRPNAAPPEGVAAPEAGARGPGGGGGRGGRRGGGGGGNEVRYLVPTDYSPLK